MSKTFAKSNTGRRDLENELSGCLFVIPSINGAHLLRRMLPTLDLPKQCILVFDQGSHDDTVAFCDDFGVGVIQFGAPRTYTESCNAALKMAGERNLRWLFIANNDITFVTSVAHELLSEMLGDSSLGIVAPSQIIVDEVTDSRLLANRVAWDLHDGSFVHDFAPVSLKTLRLESDFCELTCALIRVKSAELIDGFDDDFGFYHEDADFCFRLRAHGFTSAYLPHSQIEHFSGSSFARGMSEQKEAYLKRNKLLFGQKHMGYGLSHKDHMSTQTDSWSIINRHLHSALRKAGLLDSRRGELLFSHPGIKPYDYLFTVWETNSLPAPWLNYKNAYKAVLLPSRWGVSVFEDAGYENVNYVPLGVEVDTFNSWGFADRESDQITFLWFGRNQYRKGLDVALEAWKLFHARHQDARLIIMGYGVLKSFGNHARNCYRRGNFSILEIITEGIIVREIVLPLSDLDLVSIYRSVDFYICSSRSEGFGFSVVEAMACGVIPIFPNYGASTDMVFQGALTFAGKECQADYGDKGFEEVGRWWEPDVGCLVTTLERAILLDENSKTDARSAMLQIVRSKFTWRNTVTALRAVLIKHQAQDTVRWAGSDAPSKPTRSNLQFALQLEGEDSLRVNSSALPIGLEGFDSEFYLKSNLDIAEAGVDPVHHYVRHGWLENRFPSAVFDTTQLLASNAAARKLLLSSVKGMNKSDVEDVRRLKDAATEPKPIPTGRSLADKRRKNGVLFIGYVEAGLGIGESTRAMLRAVSKTDLKFAIYPFNELVKDRYIGRFMQQKYDQNAAYNINLLEMSTDQIPAALLELGKARTEGSYNILRTYWELASAPNNWASILKKIDEIWAPTAFVAQAFREIYSGPISVLPPCVDVSGAVADRARFAMDEARFYFCFSFDYYSLPSRKNPTAVVEAFKIAFHTGTENVGLVIKTVGPMELNGRIRAEIQRAAKGDLRIICIDQALARNEMLSLLQSSDCYVSLHRSEGFGLGMAESLALGKSLIGTNYSGNTDFLNTRTGFPVDYKLRKLLEGEYFSGDGQFWAEPDVTAASMLMKDVVELGNGTSPMKEYAKAFMAENYGAERVGSLVVRRIEQITAERFPSSLKSRLASLLKIID